MSLKKSAWGAAALAATLLLAACGGSGGSSPAPASGGDAAAGGTYGVSFDKMNAFREGEQKAMQTAAGELGVTLDLQVANTDAQRQSSQIESLISKGSKAVVSIPWDTQAVQADAEAAKAANIPFITFDQAPADLSWVTFHVGGDPLADGTAAGQFYCKAAGGQPFTLLEFQGSLNNDNGVNRSKGLNDAIAQGCPNVKIVAQIPTEWKPEPALAGTENTLSKTPDLNGIYAPTDGLLPAIFSALQKANRLQPVGTDGHVTIVSIDGDSNACKALTDKTIDMDVVTPLPQMTKDALQVAIDVAGGKPAPTPNIKKLAGLQVTPDTLDQQKSQVWGCSA
jgi:ABC-type sugar transport system substrate-binding protein